MRNLSEEELKLAINYYNEKYNLNIKKYGIKGLDVSILNKDIQNLKEGSSLSAVVFNSSHSFAIHVIKKNNKNILFIDDSYALLNTKDYKKSEESEFEIFCSFRGMNLFHLSIKYQTILI